MSELGQWRRGKGLSQEALAKKLGYEKDKWQTYAAQERGENPMPPTVAEKLRAMEYDGPMPQEEGATQNGSVNRDEFFEAVGNLKGQMESFDRRLDGLKDAIAAILDRLPPNPRPGTGR